MKKKFLAWLLTVAMVFNIALPYTAFAEDMLIDTDSSYSASETETDDDNDATDEVDGDTSTADVPTTADEQETTADEPAADGDNDAESDGKEVDQPAAAVPAQDEPKQDEPAAADEADEPADEEPLADEPLADEVAGLLGNFAAQAVSDGIMPVADTVVSGGTLQFSKDLDAEYVVPYQNPGYTKLTLTVGTYTPNAGVATALPEGTTITYQWYASKDDKISDDDTKKGTNAYLNAYTFPQGTTWYYCVVKATIDGVEYTGTSTVACFKVAAADISVTLTVNNKGVIAADKNGAAVASKSVMVSDLNADGKHTYDEALIAAHKDLLSADAYQTADSTFGLQITKLWGVETGNVLCYQNGKAITSNVGDTTIKRNDALYVSINKDDKYYSDKYTAFDVDTKTVGKGLQFELTLTDADGKALPGMSVGTWQDGKFVAIDGLVTDEDGKVKLKFDTAGSYVVTATGTINDDVIDYSKYPDTATVNFDCPIMAPACAVTVQNIGYLQYRTDFVDGQTYNYKVGEIPILKSRVSKAWYYKVDGNVDYTLKNKVVGTWYRNNVKSAIGAQEVKDISAAFTEDDIGTWYYFINSTLDAYGQPLALQSNFVKVVVTAVSPIAGSTANGFVEKLALNDGYGGNRAEFVWDKEQTDYTFDITDYIPGNIVVTVPQDHEKPLFAAWRINGKNENIYGASNGATEIAVGTAEQAVPFPQSAYYPSLKPGNTNVLTLMVGTKVDTDGDGKLTDYDEFDTYDTYNFTVTVLPSTNGLTVSSANGGTLYGKGNPYNKYEHDFYYSTDDETIKLTTNANFSKGVKLYLGNEAEPYTSSINNKLIELKDYKNAYGCYDIPIKLVATGGDKELTNTYTVHIVPSTAGPQITKQPEAISVDKGSTGKLTVEVKQPETGTLSYQWMEGSTFSTSEDPIEGATSATYEVPAAAKASNAEYYCAVTLTVGDYKMIKLTDVVKVATNLNYISPIEYTAQPGSFVYNSSEEYVTEYSAGSKFNQIWLKTPGAYTPNELSKAQSNGYGPEQGTTGFYIKYYYNSTPSVEGATEITGTFNLPSLGYEMTYGFTPDYGLPQGVWYVFCVISTASYADQNITVSTPSDFVKMTFTAPNLGMDGSGTEADPFLLKTSDDFVTIQKRVADGESFSGTYFKMANDITLPSDWVSIGPDGANGKYFGGILDGDNHQLNFAPESDGLIYHAKGAEIKNLKIYGEKIQTPAVVASSWINQVSGAWIAKIDNVTLVSGTSTLKSGFVSGSASSFNPIDISNCVAEAGVVIGYDKSEHAIGTFAGGLVGSLTNCHSAATVYGTSNVGGLLGLQSNSMAASTFVNCWFTGKIVATGGNVGGLMGAGYNANSAPNAKCVTIKNCYVSADISGEYNVGGLLGANAGIMQCWENGTGYVRDNVFYGILSGESNVGALVGFYSSLNKYNIIENNYFYDTNNHKAIGGVEYIDTSTHEFGLGKDGIFYFDTSRDSLEDIKNIVDADDIGTSDWKYTSVPKTDHNRTDDPMGADIEKLGKAMTAKQMADGTVLALLNNSETSNKNWEQAELHPIISETAYITGMTVSGDYKTEYYIGDKLDTTGMIFTATWSNGKTSVVPIDDVIITGFDSTARKVLTLTATYGSTIAKFQVSVLKADGGSSGGSSAPSTIKVKFTLLGDTQHDEYGKEEDLTIHTLAAGNLVSWLPEEEYTIGLNDTVWDLLKKVQTKHNNVKFSNPGGNYVNKVTFDGLTMEEKDNTANSGWMYTLNGHHPLLAVNEQFLESGDIIVFHWTDDYTVEEGSEDFDNSGSHLGGGGGGGAAVDTKYTAADVKDLIDKIGTVTKDSKSAIEKAREAYDSLTAAQKKNVTNYDKLTAAEKAYTELTGEKIDTAKLPFTDVAKGSWYYDAIKAMYDKGLMNGESATKFMPNNKLSRAMLVTILYRMQNEPSISTNALFNDVANGQWYTKAVAWASANNVVNGVGDGKFAPNDSVTRQEMAAMLYRYAKATGMDTTATASLNKFADSAKVADWATDAMKWAVGSGLMKGNDDNTINPMGTATRAEVATVIIRLLSK